MHLFFITRGIKDRVDALVNDLQAQYFPMKIKDTKTGKEIIGHAQGALRPIQLWSYVFPEEHLDSVLNSLLPREKSKVNDKTGINKYIGILRKMLKLKKVPKINDKAPIRLLRNKGVAIHTIGIKKDGYGVGTGTDENYHHELL